MTQRYTWWPANYWQDALPGWLDYWPAKDVPSALSGAPVGGNLGGKADLPDGPTTGQMLRSRLAAAVPAGPMGRELAGAAVAGTPGRELAGAATAGSW